jgi:hypothetical protein
MFRNKLLNSLVSSSDFFVCLLQKKCIENFENKYSFSIQLSFLKLTRSDINPFCVLVLILCFLSSCDIQPENKLTVKSDPTFVEVGPIIFKNCTPCHRAGESGPFELMTYEDAFKNKNKIKFVTQTRYMPPWPADISYSHFIGERALTPDEIDLIKVWVENGAPKGEEAQMLASPVFYVGSSFKKPDAVIKFKDAVPIKGNGADHFYVVKLPVQLPKDTFVSYFEFVPSQRKLAHHINGHLINYEPQKKKDIQSGLTYALDNFSDYKSLYSQMNILNDDGSFPALTPNTVYYLPGYTPPVYPSGIGGFKVNKTSAVLLKNIHYGPSNTNVLDSSYINVFFGPKPKRPVFETQLGTFGISKIEPELILHPNKVETFHTQASLNNDISVLSVNPHMHLLGKSFWAFAVQSNGDTIPLIKINKWDFKWQYYYTYRHPVIIKKGTVIHAYATFDNTDKNPLNPNHPSKIVTQGEGVRSMQTTEEMFQFIFTYLPYQKGDEDLDLSKGN